MKIRLTTTGANDNLLSRFFIKDAKSIKHMVDILLEALVTEPVAFLDAIKTPKNDKYIRGMLDYNMFLVSILFSNTEIDGILVPMNRMPSADYHFGLNIKEDQMNLHIFKLIKKGGIPVYDGPLRNYSEDKLLQL